MVKKIKLISTKDTYGNTLVELGEQNNNIFVIEADLMKASGSKPFMLRFPDRHINVGVAEQNLVDVAAGIALMGNIPYACTMANFMSQRACDQVFLGASYNNLNVKLIGSYAGLSQEKNGGTHISIMDYAIMRCLPNMKVIAPADLEELKQVLIETSTDIGPTYISMSRVLPENILDNGYTFKIGKACKIGDGRDLTIISTGLTTHIAIESLEELKEIGINARLIHLPTLKPVDYDSVINSAKETGAIITIENHSIYGGLGSLISEIVTSSYPVPVIKLGINDTFGLTASLDFQLEYFGLTSKNIMSSAKKILELKLIKINKKFKSL
jgi:transketolase